MQNRLDIAGWLQDVAEKATEVRIALWDGSLPDIASTDEDWDLQNALKESFEALERYERQCREKVRPETDLGSVAGATDLNLLHRLYLEMEAKIANGAMSPEDVIEHEAADPSFKLWRAFRIKRKERNERQQRLSTSCFSSAKRDRRAARDRRRSGEDGA